MDAVKALLPRLEHWMPPAIKVHVIFDRTKLIRAAIADVQLTITGGHRAGGAGRRAVPPPDQRDGRFPRSPSPSPWPQRWR